MDRLILNIKDSSKLSFFLQLIKQLDFVEIVEVKKRKVSRDYDFFKSAGLWSGREINAKELREKAWSRKK